MCGNSNPVVVAEECEVAVANTLDVLSHLTRRAMFSCPPPSPHSVRPFEGFHPSADNNKLTVRRHCAGSRVRFLRPSSKQIIHEKMQNKTKKKL